MADMHYDPSTALLVVDVQNDFADPSGSLSVAGGEGVVDAVNTQIALAVPAGALVVYTQDWHPRSTPHFAKDGGTWPVHCVADSWGAALHPRPDRRRTGGPQRRRRRRRLLGLHDARPADRRGCDPPISSDSCARAG